MKSRKFIPAKINSLKVAIEADLVFVLHWRRLFLRQETKIKALSKASNKFGKKIWKVKLSRIWEKFAKFAKLSARMVNFAFVLELSNSKGVDLEMLYKIDYISF